MAAGMREVLKGFHNELSVAAVPATFKGRSVYDLESKIPNFVTAAQGAPLSAGLILRNNQRVTLPTGSLARLTHAIDNYAGENVVLPIDFKILEPTFVTREGIMWCEYHIRMTAEQEQCVVLIFQNSARPEHIVVVPVNVLKDESGHYRRFTPVPVFEDDDIEPFPTELAPFVMPKSYMAEALTNIEKCLPDPSQAWTSPYLGITLNQIAMPDLQDVAKLQPTTGVNMRNFLTLRQLFLAASQYSDKFRIERSQTVSSTTDCIIIYQDQGREVLATVDFEHGLCHLDETKTHLVHNLRQPIDVNHQPPTTHPWLTDADYLFSTLQDRNCVFFVCRDTLPEDWDQTKSNNLSMSVTDEFCDLHILPFNAADYPGNENQENEASGSKSNAWEAQLIKGMEKVFENQIKAVGQLQAVRSISTHPTGNA